MKTSSLSFLLCHLQGRVKQIVLSHVRVTIYLVAAFRHMNERYDAAKRMSFKKTTLELNMY
jgi:hypothetical protein